MSYATPVMPNPEPSAEEINAHAWTLFRQGDLRGAERHAAEAIRRRPALGRESPLPEIWSLHAFYLARAGRAAEARELFGRVLENRPDDMYAQEGYLLALREQFSPLDGGRRGRLLLGLGTGRSGSTSLTHLWEAQSGCYSSHEHPPRLAWDGSESRQDFHLRRFDLLLDRFDHVADVAHWWLPRMGVLLKRFPDARVVVLRRERAATVASFLKVKGAAQLGGINHWMPHDGTYWTRNAWDECYPDYEAESAEEAIGLYWDAYYAAVEAMRRDYPDAVMVLPTERIGDEDAQASLLRFCGFSVPRLMGDLRLNRGGAEDGRFMYGAGRK